MKKLNLNNLKLDEKYFLSEAEKKKTLGGTIKRSCLNGETCSKDEICCYGGCIPKFSEDLVICEDW